MLTLTRHFVIVHIPKVAGSSLKESISEKFGSDDICYDYHKPLSVTPVLRKLKCLASSYLTRQIKQKIVFGHFLVGKYANASMPVFCKRQDWAYITFLRDPLQRAISHYHFWKRTDDSQHRIWRRFMKENWSLKRFLLSKEHANFQSQFFWRFPVSNFDFIGITEHYEESIQMLGCAFPEFAGLSIRSDNSNPERMIGESYTVSPELAEAFKQRNMDDYAIYEQSLKIFEQQRKRFGHNKIHDKR